MPFPSGGPKFTSDHDRKGRTTDNIELIEDLVWVSWDGATRITVPKGFDSDGASIPRFLWWMIGSPLSSYRDAALVHDWLYRNQNHPYSRKKSDQIFRSILIETGHRKRRSRTLYAGVRVGGWHAWNKARK